MIHLYVDGGVIKQNPSTVGGTCAWVIVEDDQILYQNAWVVPCEGKPITNNLTEMLALLNGMTHVSLWGKEYIVYSDSQITLNRVFGSWAWKNIPLHLKILAKDLAKSKLIKGHVLLSGHPTKKELERGYTKKGTPVSKWNVYCDKECKRVGEEYVRI